MQYIMDVKDIIKFLQKSNLKQVSRETGIPYDRMAKWRQGEGKPKKEDHETLEEYITTGKISKPLKDTGTSLGAKKAFGIVEDEGLIYVPRTQAGYAKHFMDPQYIGQLKRWKVPDFPYKGDKYRIFQIEGDSMAYLDKNGSLAGLQDGMEIVAEKVEQEDWKYTVQWYIHVIVFDDLLTIKRLYREQGDKTFVLISDNPNYSQRRVNIEDIKELWILKRYLGWNTPPPKQYEITI